MRSRLLVGAHTALYLNGHIFAKVADFEYVKNTPHRIVNVVDSLVSAEGIITHVSASGSMSIYRLHRDGGTERAGMTAVWEDATRLKYFALDLIDRMTDTVIFAARQCWVDNQSWSVRRGYVMGHIVWHGIIPFNEVVPEAQK